LVLMVLRSPKGTEGVEQGFYVVTVNVMQDCKPLGGKTFSALTWVKIGEPIPFSGEDLKDIGAIRDSARALVKAFIEAAQEYPSDSK
jgi:hypothetical protein